ncbi:MAG: hypothetical protein M9955_26515, partial [Rhizobiaceae bacterium]|nr:hypothetical protein [Rhizobiaceae bacterium]
GFQGLATQEQGKSAISEGRPNLPSTALSIASTGGPPRFSAIFSHLIGNFAAISTPFMGP